MTAATAPAEPPHPTSSADGVAWDLADLYRGLDDPRIDRDLQAAHERARAFETAYRGQIGTDAGPPADLLKAEVHDVAEAESLRVERLALMQRLDEIADERADGLLTGQQAQRATARINERLDAIELQQQDTERLRVLDGLPLGKPEVADAVRLLSPDRLRAVIDLLVTITVAPVGKGGRQFRAERVLDGMVWKV